MSRRTPILAGLAALSFACARRPPALEAAPDPRQGEVGYRFLFDATVGSVLSADQNLRSPQVQGELTLPVYPESALAGGAEAATVAVRIIVGTDGTVARVLDSPRLDSTPGPYAADFRLAAEDAVRSWSFTGGVVETFAPGEDYDGDGEADYKMLVSSQPVEVFYDVAFEFRVTDGKPVVTATPQ